MNIIKVICENNARCVLKTYEILRMRGNHVICLRWPKCLNTVVLAEVDLPYWTSKVEHLRPFSATFVLRMRTNGNLWTSGVNLDTAVRFPDPDFLLEWKISAIRRRFPLIFAFYIWISAIFLLPVCLTYWPRKYTTRVDPHVDNSHQVWSWYDIPLPSYSVFVWWYVTWPGDLDL